MIFPLEKKVSKVSEKAFIAQNASVIGNVEICEQSDAGSALFCGLTAERSSLEKTAIYGIIV